MIAPEPTAPRDPRAPTASSRATPKGVRPVEEPVGTLRGAEVNVDTRLAARVAVLVVLSGIAVAAVVLFVAGYQRNAQITSLQTHGVAVDAKVSGCIGLLGGSGSNAAGYNCTASYEYAGRHYAEGIPGSQLLATGSSLRGVVASDDPALFSTPATLAGEHTSARVYLAPSMLAALFLLLSAVWWVMSRRRRSADRSAT